MAACRPPGWQPRSTGATWLARVPWRHGGPRTTRLGLSSHQAAGRVLPRPLGRDGHGHSAPLRNSQDWTGRRCRGGLQPWRGRPPSGGHPRPQGRLDEAAKCGLTVCRRGRHHRDGDRSGVQRGRGRGTGSTSHVQIAESRCRRIPHRRHAHRVRRDGTPPHRRSRSVEDLMRASSRCSPQGTSFPSPTRRVQDRCSTQPGQEEGARNNSAAVRGVVAR